MNDDKSLWDGNTVNPPLRRPGSINNSTLQESKTVEVTKPTQEATEVSKPSRLRVDAREWFPPNYNHKNVVNVNVEHKSVNDRLNKYKLQNSLQTLETTNNDICVSTTCEEDNFTQRKALQQLEEIMSNLIVDPGNFDNLVGLFIEILDPYYEDISFLSYIAESIVGKALNESNFRYSAARLCNLIQDQYPLFRGGLCMLCQKKVKDDNSSSLALLLAELFVQLNYDNIYGGLVIESIKGVLSCGESNSIKAVCQVLKLTGSSLERRDKESVNGIFTKLIASKDSQLLCIKNLIDSVLNLRSSNWGQIENNINITNNRYQHLESQVFHDGPIFYGPDGHELSEEECQFLNENCSKQSDLNDGSYSDSYDEFDPEMDEEMQAAYDQFLRCKK